MNSYTEPLIAFSQESDPDPFTIGIGLFALAFAGGAYLEARRQRQFLERQAQEQFRTTWFNTRRTLIHYRRVVDEFATYAAEENFGSTQFGFGRVRLSIDRGRAEALQRLHGNVHTTATHLADDLAELSEFLGAEEQPDIDAIMKLLQEQTAFPGSYTEVIELARNALRQYEQLIAAIDERVGFSQ